MPEVESVSSAAMAIFTVVSNNYLHFARTLLQTVARHHPDADIYCVIVDKDPGPSAEYSREFSVLRIDELGIPDLKQMIFQYNVLEFNTAVKPWAFETLLRKGYKAVIYLDPDIFVYRPLKDVVDALSDGSSIVITPHLLAPVRDDKHPSELDIRRAGTYNFGFCAVGRSDTTFEFLRWWQSKLFRDCIVDPDRGIFVDQSWIDLVPGLFDKVFILRNPAYNFAYWNVAQRTVKQEPDGSWTVNGEPLVFFHFSGLNPLSPEAFSKHQNRFTLSTLGPSATLVQDYVSALIENGAKTFSKLTYGYASFSDGTPISDAFRRLYLQNETLREQMGDDPFQKSDILTQLAMGDGSASVVPITWSMYCVYKYRPELQFAFNLLEPEGASGYWNWFTTDKSTGVSEPVLEYHQKKWLEKNRPITAPDLMCIKLFASLLDRSPSQSELDSLRTLCRTKLGASIALMKLTRTREHQNRPKRTRRYKRAMRAIWQAKDLKQIQPPVFASAIAEHNRPRSLSGIHPPDTDFHDNGAWCSPRVSIPLGNGKHGMIKISGNFYPSSLARMNGRRSLGLNLQLDGQQWKRIDLPESGEIDVTEEVPDELSKAKVLHINADNFFVPSTIGEGPDQRELAWRLREVQIDDVAIFNSKRHQPFLPMSELFRPEGFNIIGYVFAELGIGEAARTMARSAEAAGIPYSLYDVGYQTTNRQSDRRAEANASDKTFDVDIVYVNADQTANTLKHLSQKGRPGAAYRIGFWHWEQPRLPEIYWGGFEGLDEIWVPTAFVHEAVSAVSPLPVVKIPHAVDFTVEPRWTRSSFGIPDRKFAVLVMYDFHSYRFRKNPEAAIAAFKLAARGRDDMALVIKTINASAYPDDYGALKAEVAGLTNVVFIDEVYSREQIYALEASCDCMLSLHRAEGFGFGPAEMMFLGKPVIATGWSGNMEFMTNMNSFPVNYELKLLEKSLGAYAAGLHWAEPDVEHAAACLRQVVESQALARDIGSQARHTMRTKFNPQEIGKQYLDRLAWISAQL